MPKQHGPRLSRVELLIIYTKHFWRSEFTRYALIIGIVVFLMTH